MTAKENPVPRANAESRADSKAERDYNRPSAIDLKADAATVWFARIIPVPAPVARILAALASLGGAFG